MAIDFFLYICTPKQWESSLKENARIAQLVERNLAKVEVASSNLVSRSKAQKNGLFFCPYAFAYELMPRWWNR